MSNPAAGMSRSFARTVRFATWLALLASTPQRTTAQLIPGVAEWAEATTQLSQAKWKGPRVPFPTPTPRPAAAQTLVSSLYPVAVHGSAHDAAGRLGSVLSALESAYVSLASLGLLSRFGDGGQGGTAAHDLYMIDDAPEGYTAFVDATWPVRELDAASAFAGLDRRLPHSALDGCATEALTAIALLELDPAESAAVRASTATALSELLTGQPGCSSSADRWLESPEQAPFPAAASAQGASFLLALMRRGDGANPEGFLRDSLMLARQLTWEGRDLRASPSLLEAMARILSFSRMTMEDAAGELAVQRASDSGLTAMRVPFRVQRELSSSSLPARLPALEPPLEPFGSAFLMVHTQGARAGEGLGVWLHGELGARWSLLGTRFAADGRALAQVRSPIRDHPDRFMRIDLDVDTAFVLLTVTNLGTGEPSPNEAPGLRARSAALTLAR